MANELVLLEEINEPYLKNDDKEKQIKVRIRIEPSQEVRERCTHDVIQAMGSDICIVLDVSQSMRDVIAGKPERTGEVIEVEGIKKYVVRGGITKLDASLEAIKKLIPLLRENDTLSLIAYEDEPHVIFSGYTSRDKTRILSELENCRKYSGNTNISGALGEARALLSSVKQERPKKVIFLTDGQPYGDTEEKGITQGKLLADYNITMDCLGFGNDFNYAFMEKIASFSKGRTDIIKTPEDAEKIFESLFRRAQSAVATNVKLTLNFSPNVRVTEHYRGTPENLYLGKVILPTNERKYTLTLGQIERSQRYDYYFLVTVPPQVDYKGRFRLMKAEAEYYIPAMYGESVEKTSKNVIVEFGNNPELINEKNGDVERGYLLAEIKKLEDEADIARANKNHVEVISRYESIIEIFETLGMVAQLKNYREVLEKYKATGDISLDELNNARRSSSQAADAGVLEEPLREEDELAVFGQDTGLSWL